MRLFLRNAALGLALTFAPLAQADTKFVFCHYMVGTLTPGSGHAELDIDQAQAMGFDAFALNVGSPTADWALNTTDQLFTHAALTGFKLFFSLDLGAEPDLSQFYSFLNQYLGHDAYFIATPNGKPMISTFNGGTLGASTWSAFRNIYDVYFVPDFDDAPNYYTNPTTFLSSLSTYISGTFSWETAWPWAGTVPSNVSITSDELVQTAGTLLDKSYMISLSTLQYKHLPSQNLHWYRAGEVTLPQRMTQILAMPVQPDYVEVLTWNDAGESHYIGSLHAEGIPPEQLAYANSTDWPHEAWQPVISSFIAAYKSGGSSSLMAPPAGSAAVGAMWYRSILKDAVCANDPLRRPTGWQAAQDAVNYAIVLPADASGLSIRISSDGTSYRPLLLLRV